MGFNISEFTQVLFYSTAQSFFVSLFSLSFGFFGALGLLCLQQSRAKKITEIFLLLPSLLPALFVIVATMNFMTLLTAFPFGMTGVIIVFIFMYTGAVSVGLSRLLSARWGGMVELALVEGASRLQFLMAAIGSVCREILTLFFFVFVMAFASFSVPLIVGGESGQTLEVLIYKMSFGRGLFAASLAVAIFQMVFLGLLSIFFKTSGAPRATELKNTKLICSPWALAIGLATTAALVFASIRGLPAGLQEILSNEELKSRIFSHMFGTAFESLVVSLLVFSTLLLLAYFIRIKPIDKILMAVVAPSTVFVGLAIYLLIDFRLLPNLLTLLVVSVGFALLNLPSLYRYRGREVLHELDQQREVARVLGANDWQIFKEISLPQLWRDFCFLAGIAALWASGDFAFATLVAGRELTLAMTAQNLLGGYHIEAATLVMWLSLLIGIIIFLIFERLGRVGYKKSFS